MTGTEFGEWLDSKAIGVGEASSYFGVSEKTIYQWRSTAGVPASKVEWVRSRMREYTQGKDSTGLPERLSLEITREQLSSWNRASLLAGKIIYDWAAEILDEAAELATEDSTGLGASTNPLQSLPRVAEDSAEYGVKKKDRPA
jgi:hypothetical protein